MAMYQFKDSLGNIWGSLSGKFLLAGGLVMSIAAAIVGTWVSNRIEQGVVQNTATAAALYMESFVAPLSQELANDEGLSDPARAALQEIFTNTALGERVVSYKIWKEGGRVVEASDPELRGRTFEPSDDLRAAWQGTIAASFEDLDGLEDAGEAALGIPLLEVYSPIHEVWTGEVIAVAEFYERAEPLANELADARRQSWLVVIAVFATSGLTLFGIVRAGSLLIERQRGELQHQLTESQSMFTQIVALKERVTTAAQRSTAQSDRVMQRIGQDLHDGVAQHLSLASLRFEEADPTHKGNAETVRQALDTAMAELRAISRGLALPDIDQLSINSCVARAVDDHRKAFHSNVQLEDRLGQQLSQPYAIKLCVYRFVQEALSNASRHAQATSINVVAELVNDTLSVSVKDNGLGFDTEVPIEVREDGGQGLSGLKDRAATLNGHIEVISDAGSGTEIRLQLPLSEDTA